MTSALRGGPRRRVASLLGLALLCSAPAAGPGEPALSEGRLKAEFIERFTRFTEWPATSSLADPASPFVIGVFGRNSLADSLEGIAAARRAKGRPILVQRVLRLEGIEACHVLFIPRSQRQSLPQILARAFERPILTVGDVEGFAEAGVIVNFFVHDERLRFEINTAAAERSGLRIGAPLLELARVVRPPGFPR